MMLLGMISGKYLQGCGNLILLLGFQPVACAKPVS